jgi:hypothetical protein
MIETNSFKALLSSLYHSPNEKGNLLIPLSKRGKKVAFYAKYQAFSLDMATLSSKDSHLSTYF